MKNKSLEKVNYFYNQLTTKAWESETFKKELVSNPEATIAKVLGDSLSIPEGKKIVVEDQTNPNTFYINIPRQINVNELDLDLTDEQLEMISGGDGGLTALAVIGGVVAICQAIEWFGDGWNSWP